MLLKGRTVVIPILDRRSFEAFINILKVNRDITRSYLEQ